MLHHEKETYYFIAARRVLRLACCRLRFTAKGIAAARAAGSAYGLSII